MPDQDQLGQSNLDQLAAQAANPAAPEGLKQTATAARGVASGADDFAQSNLGAKALENGFVDSSQSWFTGANVEGENNGWATDFQQKFMDGQNQAAADGTLSTYFENGGTGVVTWDHQSLDGNHDYHFGDVYVDGKRVANVYDQFADQPGTADLLMGQYTLDARDLAEAFKDSDPMGALGRRVEEQRQTNNVEIPKALQAAEFQSDVAETTKDWESGPESDLAVGGAALGGAVTGAAVGSILPGVGTAVGAGVGAAVGGGVGLVGGLLNRDEITEQAARSYEITKLADDTEGGFAGATQFLQQWGGFTQTLTSPLANLTHGLVELTGDNQVGDAKSAYYAVDDKGESTRPMWARPLSLGANVGDGLMQFISPLNRSIYTAQMSAVIGGESAMLATTGKTFDPRQGGFENIFLNDQGGFDPTSAAAGILKVGIDVVQLAGLRGLAHQAAMARGAVKEGEQIAHAAGYKFTLDETGQAVGKKATYVLLAPSEQVAAASARRAARVQALKENRAVTADDFYRAATSMAAGGSAKLKAALLNGFGEGYEEVAQALLEPISVDGDIVAGQVVDAFLQGAAAGAGMGLGATYRAPSSAERLKSQAYALATFRNGGVEPGPEWDAAWEKASDSERRVQATRTRADIEVTRQAVERLAQVHAATMVASGVDAAKARDAKLSAVERDLQRASGKTDAFHVIAGTLDADPRRPAEAVEAGALTIARLLEDRARGLETQRGTLTDRIARLEAADTSDPATAERLTEARSMLATLELSQQVGARINSDVARLVNEIYDPATAAPDAQRKVMALNRVLESIYMGRATVTAPEGVTASPEDLLEAARQFVTLLHAREPKLDSGSYVALLPRASWQLTADRAENMLQVNTDILGAINGDFDGDKLRSEYQLILPQARYEEARSGQNLTGRGSSVDVATRNFDEALVQALATSLTDTGQVKDEAEAVLARIREQFHYRYQDFIYLDAEERIFSEFRTAVLAGSADARVDLLNAVAREASEAMAAFGRATLRNEWLWISQLVRWNLQEFQPSFRRLRAAGAGPSALEAVADLDTEPGTNAHKQIAVNDAQTLALFAVGNTLFRKFQKIHYTFYNSRVLSAAKAAVSDLFESASFYEELARGVTRPEITRTGANDSIAGRVLAMLSRLVDDALEDPALRGKFSPSTAMSVLANVKVKDVWWESGEPVTDGQDLSLAQLLLKRALDADLEEHRLTFDSDVKLQAKHARLRALTIPNEVAGAVNAERAFIEIFKAIPFQDSLGGVVGNLAPHTTPEQWLRNYIAQDPDERASFEKLFTNHPQYLDRKKKGNLPYSLSEATRRDISPYRSMVDALLAVGRSELTFNPEVSMRDAAKAFGGRQAEVSQRAQEDYIEAHGLIRKALEDYRKVSSRSSRKRKLNAELLQEMFEANPQFGRAVLEMIPDSAANAVFEWRDEQLYVVPWIYEMFAIEDAKESLFFYWKNLTLSQWASTQSIVHEDDSDAPGRQYNKLQSRFQRLLYELAREPGQMHYELLVREMDRAKDLDQFFLWLNSTPGFRGRQAVLLPFNDDVAEFEADAGGGWVTNRAGADLRAAIAAVRLNAEQLRKTMRFREAADATDRAIHAGLVAAFNNDPTATPLDYENLRRLERVVQTSTELPRGFAPSAMLALTQGVARGFDAHSHDKGVTADSYQPLGEFQALMDAFAFVPGLERVMETLTAHSITSLRTNVGDLAKHGGTAMDADGRQIQWERMTVEQALDLLGDPRTKPLAHTLLTPQVLDVANGKMTERLMMDASLKDLLDEKHFKDLFRLEGSGALNRATQYLSLVDARARAEGGHFDVQRYVNDLTVTRLSKLGRPATDTDIERIKQQAYLDTARAVQMLGQLMASSDMRDAGAITQLRKLALSELRANNKGRRLPGFVDDTGGVIQALVDGFLQDLERDQLEAHKEIVATYPAGAERERRLAVVDAQYDRNAEMIRAVLEDDVVAFVVDRFQDPSQIADYVRSMTSFPARAPESASLWSRLMAELEAGRFPDDSFDWDTLGRSAMGVYLADQMLRVATHVSLPPMFKPTEAEGPEESSARFYKYFDPSFGYLVTDLLNEDSPVAAAAQWMHMTAEQPRGAMSLDEMSRTLKRTVINDVHLGAWTPGLLSQLVESQQRMDSAAAGQAIAAAGNGPKRWAAISFATRRTNRAKPGPELVTTAALTGDYFATDALPFNEFALTPAGVVEPTTMPVAQLDNRFYTGVRVNGVEVPLTGRNLGFSYQGDTEAMYVALPRLREAIQRAAKEQGVELSATTVELDFFHPDSRPAGAEWANSVWFDGMAHSLAPDTSESLVATLWSDNGGMISLDTQRPLDASKKGLRAIQPFVRSAERDLALAEANEMWAVHGDLAGMLRRKTELAMRYDDGTGALEASDYNAVYKIMALQHIVVGEEAGRPAAMTAAEVLAFKAANGNAAPLPLDNARLVTLSPEVLRSMLGETGSQGVPRFFDDEFLLNPDLVEEFTSINEAMLRKFSGMLEDVGSLKDTSLVHTGAQRTMKVRSVLTDAERNARSERIIFLDEQAARVRDARHSRMKKREARDGFKTVLKLAMGSVSTERHDFDFMAAGLPIAPKDTQQAKHSIRLLEAYNDALAGGDYNRGWQVVDQGGPDYQGGVLTVESLDKDRPLEHQLVRDDLTLIRLDSFARPERDITQRDDRLVKALAYVTRSGSNIVLGSGDGQGDLRDFAATWLEDHGYAPVIGSRHLYAPVEFTYQTQNEKAYASTLTETGRLVPAWQIITFLLIDPIGTDENDAILNPATRKLRDRKRLDNLLPTSMYPNYNLPVEDGRDDGIYARALAHLRTTLDPANADARLVLLDMAGPDQAGALPIEEALNRFHAKISSRASLVPEVGDRILQGDIIPFVHANGRVVLYRHGMKAPKPDQLRELQDRGGMNIALAQSETEPLATANEGVIAAVDPRQGYGRSLGIETPLQQLGNKIQLEWNGMKYVLVGPTAAVEKFMRVPIFGNGTVADLFSDLLSADSKEAHAGRVNNLRNALTFFQYDFTDDLTEFFFPGDVTAETRVLTYSMLERLGKSQDYKIPLAAASEIAKAQVAVADLLSSFATTEVERGRVPADWVDRFPVADDVSGSIARAVLTYLVTPGANIDNVLKSAGFSHPDAANTNVTVRQVPGVFADLLDQGFDSPLHEELVRRFDGQLDGWKLHKDWTVEVFDGTGDSLRGYLQFGEAHSSGDNPVLDGQAYDPNSTQTVSSHNAMAAALSLGAITSYSSSALKRSKAFARSFSRGGGVAKFSDDAESFWSMLTAIPDEADHSLAGWRREGPAETARRQLARQEIVGFFQPLNTDGWPQGTVRSEYEATTLGILSDLNLYGSQIAMVETWIRQHLGKPYGVDDSGTERGIISLEEALEVAKTIRDNVRSRLLPTAGANVPLIDVNHLTVIYMANLNRADGWAPRESTEKNSPSVKTWDAWVDTAFGTAWLMAEGQDSPVAEPDFDVMFQLAMDGLMHGYQGATTSTRYLPVSTDALRDRQLMDPETNRMMVSISDDENLLATDPMLFNTTAAALEEIVGGTRIYGPGRDGPDPKSARGRQRARIERWRTEVDAPRQAKTKMRGVRSGGQTFLGHTTTTSAFWRSMINLRAGNALFNVALVVSAPLEAFYRRTINTFANVATGESTGAIGKAQVRLAERFADTKIGAVAEQLGLTPTYSSDELKQLGTLVDALSSRTEFKALVYKELMFQYPTMPGIGRVEKWLEKYAKFGARIQDPAWGMLPKDLARIYVETVMRRIAADPMGSNVYSTERLLTGLGRNPEWLKDTDLETHNMAIAAISNVRSLKPGVLSLGVRGIIEPLSESPKFGRNTAANMLKMMTLFQNFWSNSLINLTGLQGVADFAAFHLDGKQKGKLVRRLQAGLRSEEFQPDEAEFYDMSEAIEGMDLADSFIRGGITHTALFTLGMFAGGLGLTGEDDEEKFRRRQAELQGAGFVHDPRKLANDFRNKDAIFLNWLPFGLDSYFKADPTNPDSDAMAQMNWVMRYFASPVLGFERFYETGDFSEVMRGFTDAIGSHPIVNTQLWNEARDTAAELHSQSNDAIEAGDNQHGAHLLVTAVGVMERAMLENSMINMIYVGTDRYDRDQYALPALDSDGNPQVDVRGNPYETNQALKQYVNDNGTPDNPKDDFVAEGYVARDAAGATIRTMTENRFGLAVLGSLFTGITGGGFTSSDMFRQNMPIKTRQVELLPTDQASLEAGLLAAFQGENALSAQASGPVQLGLTEGEAAQKIKNEYQAAGIYWDAAEVEKMAATLSAQSQMAALSMVDEAGREHLTDEGIRAVFDGLRKGTVTLADAALNGVYMTKEQRDKIRDDLSVELVQEGVDYGLTKDQATWRMRRIMFGTGTEAGTPTLSELIYTDQLPWTDKLEYNQLNTTYVTGPNGMPMATGFTRDGLMGALGLKPLNRTWTAADTGLATDSRLNTVDNVVGINTGLRALEPRPESWEIPSIEDVTKQAAKDVIDAINKLDFTPSVPYANKPGTGYGYGGYGGYSYGGGRGYRHYGSGGGGYFTRMYAFPNSVSPYGNSIPFINTSNPIIRRGDVRRERVWSERGRLKQWQ